MLVFKSPRSNGSNYLLYDLKENGYVLARAEVFIKKIKTQEVRLESLFVIKPENRRRGLGQKLIEHMCHDLLVNQKKTLLLVTKPTKESISFYLKMGFVKIHDRLYIKQLLEKQ